MEPTQDTSWTIIEAAAEGDGEARERLATLYSPALEAYFRKRWQANPILHSVDDAVQEVFVDCFKPSGVLERADGKNKDGDSRDAPDADTLATDDDKDLTRLFDREWARSIVQEAAFLDRDRDRSVGGREGGVPRQADPVRHRFA